MGSPLKAPPNPSTGALPAEAAARFQNSKIVSCSINYMVALWSPFGFTSIQLWVHIKILSNPFWFHQIVISRSLEFDFDVLGFGLVRSGFISYIWVRTISEPVCFFSGECPLRQCSRLAKRTTEKTMGLWRRSEGVGGPLTDPLPKDWNPLEGNCTNTCLWEAPGLTPDSLTRGHLSPNPPTGFVTTWPPRLHRFCNSVTDYRRRASHETKILKAPISSARFAGPFASQNKSEMTQNSPRWHSTRIWGNIENPLLFSTSPGMILKAP